MKLIHHGWYLYFHFTLPNSSPQNHPLSSSTNQGWHPSTRCWLCRPPTMAGWEATRRSCESQLHMHYLTCHRLRMVSSPILHFYAVLGSSVSLLDYTTARREFNCWGLALSPANSNYNSFGIRLLLAFSRDMPSPKPIYKVFSVHFLSRGWQE